MKDTVLIALSGGVDSAVCALLLQNQGYSCMAATMRLRAPECGENGCCTEEDIRLARGVAEKLGIPYEIYDFSTDFSSVVIDDFVRTYCEGGTPNPCIVCNRHLKFEMLFKKGEECGASKIATGHYARICYDESSGRYRLLRALDPAKDQSYVLYTLTQGQLSRTLFPLGEMIKNEVRALAAQNGFENAERRDSQDICFIDDGEDYASFIEKRLGKNFESGDFVDTDGRVLGRHRGIIRYTIGQRKGLGLALPEPLYVKQKDMQANRVILSKEEGLFSDTLEADSVNLISVAEIGAPMRVRAKVRYRQSEQWATVTQLDRDRIRVVFDEPQRAIALGQSVVLYDGDTVVGGGKIAKV